MKKRFILFSLWSLCSISICLAQSTNNREFKKKEAALTQKLQQSFEENNYEEAEKNCKAQIALFNEQDKETQKEYNWVLQSYYYNLACAQSMLKKKEEALKSFRLARQNGYIDYQHILRDTDLDNIRKEKAFEEILAQIREEGDYLYILQKSPRYAKNEQTDTLPRFTYLNRNDSNLVKVRQYFKLDSVAGHDDEISQIKNILTFIHNKIKHDGQHGNPQQMNAIALAEACKDGSRGLNCRGLATVLNECYLAMGFKSRFITCMPKRYINDCHVINAVYSSTLNKWLWIDPTNNTWVTDENGILLSIQEVRERLRDGRPLKLNEEANWNNQEKITKKEYLDNYMTKNLYYVNCTLRSEFGTEDKKYNPADYIALMPEGYYNEMEKGSYIVYDDAWFWQSPCQE